MLVIGGAGFIGSHVVSAILKEGVKSVTVFDNLGRGDIDYLEDSLRDERCIFYPNGGDIRDDILMIHEVLIMSFISLQCGCCIARIIQNCFSCKY